MKVLRVVLLFTLFYSFSSFSTFNKTFSDGSFSIIENDQLSLIIDDILDMKHIIKSDFNQNTNKISIETVKEIAFLQVLRSDGALEFQLPVSSPALTISLNGFKKGNYQVILLLEKEQEIINISMTKKT